MKVKPAIWEEGVTDEEGLYLRLIGEGGIVYLVVGDTEGRVKGSGYIGGITSDGKLEVYSGLDEDLGLQLTEDNTIEVVEI